MPDDAIVIKIKSSDMNKHMKIVVIGGRGLIGTKLVNNLRQYGHEVVAASRSSGINTGPAFLERKRRPTQGDYGRPCALLWHRG
jgi:hypothetical protein